MLGKPGDSKEGAQPSGATVYTSTLKSRAACEYNQDRQENSNYVTIIQKYKTVTSGLNYAEELPHFQKLDNAQKKDILTGKIDVIHQIFGIVTKGNPKYIYDHHWKECKDCIIFVANQAVLIPNLAPEKKKLIGECASLVCSPKGINAKVLAEIDDKVLKEIDSKVKEWWETEFKKVSATAAAPAVQANPAKTSHTGKVAKRPGNLIKSRSFNTFQELIDKESKANLPQMLIAESTARQKGKTFDDLGTVDDLGINYRL